MRLGSLGACAAALLSACGGSNPSAPPAPVPGPPPAPVTVAPSGPLHYRVRGALAYEVERYDSLFYASMPGAPQGTAKRGILTVRPLPGRSSDVEVRLDSLVGLEDTRLTPGAIDSSIGSRWQFTLGADGPTGTILGGRPTILAGQMEAMVRLLFPQLPSGGLRSHGVWADSMSYPLKLDAFEASETATRTSQAVPGTQTPSQGPAAVTVESNARLARSGTAVQARQTMTLKGAGVRRVRYEFAEEGWVHTLTARDSLDLMVAVGPGGETVAVRWRSTLIGRRRDLPLR